MSTSKHESATHTQSNASTKGAAMNTKKNTTTKQPATATAPAGSASHASSGSDAIVLGDDVVNECVALLAQVGTLLGPVDALSPTDIRHSLKLRKGAAQVIGQIVNLCEHNGITSVGQVTVQEMSDQWARATALSKIEVQLVTLQKKVNDAAFTAESTAWQYATALYTTLQRLTKMNPTLRVALQPVKAFFQTVRTKGNRQDASAAKTVKAGQQAAAKHPKVVANQAAGSGAEPAPSEATTATPSAPTASPASAPAGAAPVAGPAGATAVGAVTHS